MLLVGEIGCEIHGDSLYNFCKSKTILKLRKKEEPWTLLKGKEKKKLNLPGRWKYFEILYLTPIGCQDLRVIIEAENSK